MRRDAIGGRIAIVRRVVHWVMRCAPVRRGRRGVWAGLCRSRRGALLVRRVDGERAVDGRRRHMAGVVLGVILRIFGIGWVARNLM